jgi:parvulin-like peptidyl-prolyl isomerase
VTLYVNDQKVDQAMIDAEFQRLAPSYVQHFPDKPEEEARDEITTFARENVIEQVLLQQAAQREGADVPPERIDEAYEMILKQHGGKTAFYRRFFDSDESKEAEVKKDVERRMRTEAFIESITGDALEITEEEMKKFYQDNPERFLQPERVHAAHIVKHAKTPEEIEKARPELEQVRKRLRNKANFAEQAKEHSDCPDNNGDLGVFPRGQMVPEFEEVVFKMEPGEISEVFESPFGVHIAQVSEKFPETKMPYEEAHEAIERNLPQIKRQEAIEKFIDKEKANAVIEEKDD